MKCMSTFDIVSTSATLNIEIYIHIRRLRNENATKSFCLDLL